MKDLQGKLKHCKVLFLDADGVWFDVHEHRSVLPDGQVIIGKSRSHQDGQGLSFIRELGIRVVFVSGEGQPLQSVIDKINDLPSVRSNRWSVVEIFTKKNAKGAKLETMMDWLEKNDLSLADAVYMGDDINDLECMSAVQEEGLTVAPANLTRVIKPVADITTHNRGGHGAIRELAEMILDARGISENDFPPA